MRGKRGGFATMPFCAPGALQRAGRYNFGKRKRENVGADVGRENSGTRRAPEYNSFPKQQ